MDSIVRTSTYADAKDLVTALRDLVAAKVLLELAVSLADLLILSPINQIIVCSAKRKEDQLSRLKFEETMASFKEAQKKMIAELFQLSLRLDNLDVSESKPTSNLRKPFVLPMQDKLSFSALPNFLR
ncbi:hypothetical protein CAPTEDRAFT_201719 [Capitella teleta]|uniref:Uncharacterized protein n=1 Tax=Capitella teleta TaxID=283909 RepID=R7TRV8_CAPTE|nr:hypothetical protein CAPTEDRAFT_184889 [Capitella teleta]ELT94236.1 hypothetical protein CAPTEDRAFT_201719 [Capitella teleta]|eukprot:ELT90104.1 hypothetical protein CAPTEDRAFT_184889 [Capitella teleta]